MAENLVSSVSPKPFTKGWAGGPGRPKGSRQKLQELAVGLLHEDFAIHGKEVIERVREKKPEVYLASVVSLLPKQQQKMESPFVELTDDELDQLEQLLAAIRAKPVPQTNGSSEPNERAKLAADLEQLSKKLDAAEQSRSGNKTEPK